MNQIKKIKFYLLLLFVSFVVHGEAYAATLRISPDTGVYTVGSAFSVNVLLNSDGKSVNAADGQISFNPKELQVVSVSRANSIFNLWTEEPSFSNSAGTISFGGGSPTGYKGGSGAIVNIRFKGLGAGTPKVQFRSGSILAADGLGTNILTAMNGASYTISAVTDSPEPEYITPANTPKAPVVTSSSHPNQDAWYKEKTVKLNWSLPNDVVAIRTLLDTNPGTIPTVVYEERLTEKVIDNLDEGTSYFHIQFKNSEGWGKITHFKLNVDSENPQKFTIEEHSPEEPDAPLLVLKFSLEDISPILEYSIQLDGKDPFVFKDSERTAQYGFSEIAPGHHTVAVEAFDSAGNSTIATHSFTVSAFEKPIFIDYPTRINTEVIPAIKGKTYPRAKIAIEIVRASDGSIIKTVEGSENDEEFTIVSDDSGEFLYIPDTAFEQGVYSIRAIAKDSRGRLSEKSDEIKIIVEEPGYITLGTMVINALSVLIPLLALILLLIFGSWFLWHKLSLWKRKVRKETREAEISLSKEFDMIIKNLDGKICTLKESRKGKVTTAETELITQIEEDLRSAEKRIAKEITDIENSIK